MVEAVDRLPLSLRGLRDAVLGGDPACLCDPELFTGPDVEEPELDRLARVAVARQVCAECPVRLACLAYALRIRPEAGVWGGFTADEVAVLSMAAGHPAAPGLDAVIRPGQTLLALAGGSEAA